MSSAALAAGCSTAADTTPGGTKPTTLSPSYTTPNTVQNVRTDLDTLGRS